MECTDKVRDRGLSGRVKQDSSSWKVLEHRTSQKPKSKILLHIQIMSSIF